MPNQIDRPTELRPEQLHGTRHAQTTLDPAVLADPAFAFFCQLHLGSGRSSHHVLNNATTIETAHHTWTQLGQPQPSALGLTVTPDEQLVWCQHPNSDCTHPLT